MNIKELISFFEEYHEQKKEGITTFEPSGIFYHQNGVKIVTYDYGISVGKKEGEFLPFFVQSCMDLTKKTWYPVILEVMEKEQKVKISSHYQTAGYDMEELETMQLKKFQIPAGKGRGCIPCRNCGRC